MIMNTAFYRGGMMRRIIFSILLSAVLLLPAHADFSPVSAYTYISLDIGSPSTFKTDFGFSSTNVSFNDNVISGVTAFTNNKVALTGTLGIDGTVTINNGESIYIYWDLYTAYPMKLYLYESGPLGESSWTAAIDENNSTSAYGFENAIEVYDHKGTPLLGNGCSEVSVSSVLWDKSVTSISSGTLQANLILRLESY